MKRKGIICGCFAIVILIMIGVLFGPHKLVPDNTKFEIMTVAIWNDNGQQILVEDKLTGQDKEKLEQILRSYTCTLCPNPKRYDDSFEDIQYLIHTSYETDIWWYLMIYDDQIYKQGGKYYYAVKNSEALKAELDELLKPYVE